MNDLDASKKQDEAAKCKDWASVIHYIDVRLKGPNPNVDALLDQRLEAMKRYAALQSAQLI